MQRALHLHRHGSMREAASLCEEVLRQQENHFDALHLLGVIHLQSGFPESGLNLVEKALAQRPDESAAWLSKGNALFRLHKPQAALDAFDQALALNALNALA